MTVQTNALKRKIASSILKLGAIFAAGGLIAAAPHSASAQTYRCPCHFSNPSWKAYGTDADCATYMHNGKTCEVDFGGLGASPKLVSKVLHQDPRKYRAQTFATLELYLRYLKNDNRSKLASLNMLMNALPMLARGAYLRGPADDKSVKRIRVLDQTFQDFMKKDLSAVSGAFLSKRPTFSTLSHNAKFEVGHGYIVVNQSDDRLVVVYMPPE